MSAAYALLIVIAISGGLVIDQFGGPWGQALVNAIAWALFAGLLARSLPSERVLLWACLVFATLGEIFLALIWGIYDYRLGNLPLFVPPGHVLLYALGLWLAQRMPAWLADVLVVAAAVAGLGFALTGQDMLSLPLVALFLLCMRFGPTPRLYATMFPLALAMELWGTWLGNWTWRGTVPWLDWPTLNPPFAAGAFYCVLDALVGLVRRARIRAWARTG